MGNRESGDGVALHFYGVLNDERCDQSVVAQASEVAMWLPTSITAIPGRLIEKFDLAFRELSVLNPRPININGIKRHHVVA